jgi:hypothetical protein
VQNIPDSLKDSLEQYLGQGYTVIPGMFDKSQLDIAFREWNYHTQSRGIDLNNPATWDNIQKQHDWKQGWVKWLFATGIQVLSFMLPLLSFFIFLSFLFLPLFLCFNEI